MNTLNVLLIALLNFISPNKEYCPWGVKEPGLARTLTDVVWLAKGRILASLIKEGMTPKEVYLILGLPGVHCGASGFNNASWIGYGISIDFASCHNGEYDPRVTRVSFDIPPKLKWDNLWSLQIKWMPFLSSLFGPDSRARQP
jgi:hypothetical protein